MVEVDTSYLWQTPGGVDAQVLCASAPVSSTSNIHADIGVFMPVSALFISGNTPFLQISV